MATILFAGGDRRTFAAISYLKKQGFEVKTYALTHRSPVDGRGVFTLNFLRYQEAPSNIAEQVIAAAAKTAEA